MVRILSGCLVLALVVTSQASAADSKEPSYGDKTLTQWLKALDGKNRQEQQRSLDAIGIFGPDARAAIPRMLELLKETKDQPEERWFRISLVAALGVMGPEAKDALPEILPLLRADYPDDRVRRALVQIGGPEADERLAVRTLLLRVKRCSPPMLLSDTQFVQANATRLAPHLAVLLKDDSIETRRLAARSLIVMGSKAQNIARSLEEALKDKDDEVSQFAAIALTKADAKQLQPMVAFLVRRSMETPARTNAAFALTSIGPDVLPQLVPLLDHDNATVAEAARTAFVSLGEPSLPLLTKVLANGSTKSRTAAASALGQLSARHPAARTAILDSLKDGDREVRLVAAEALVQYRAAEVERAIPVLAAVAEQGASTERERALAALQQLGPQATDVTPVLLRALEDQDRSVRHQAALSLEAVDRTKAEAAVPVLAEVVALALPRCRTLVPEGAAARAIAAAAALGRIGSPARSALPTLQRAMGSGSPALGVASARAAVAIDPEQAGPAVKTLTRLLKIDPQTRALSLQALSIMGPTAKAAAPVLEGMLEPKPGQFDFEVAETLVRVDAAQAGKVMQRLPRADHDGEGLDLLCRIASVAPDEAVPVLSNLLLDPKFNAYRQRQAMKALGEVGAKAATAIPVLLELAGSKNAAVKRSAAEALKKIDPEAATLAGIR